MVCVGDEGLAAGGGREERGDVGGAEGGGDGLVAFEVAALGVEPLDYAAHWCWWC